MFKMRGNAHANFLPLAVALALCACGPGGGGGGGGKPGEWATTVDLQLTEKLTRNQEAPIGNLITDAILDAFTSGGVEVAIINGGALRCPPEHDATKCADYSIPAGPITQAELEIVLALDNELVVKEISGAALKSTMERSVSTIPSQLKGWFLHVAGMTYSADCSKTAQQLTTDKKSIVTEGSRITEVTVGGVAIDPAKTYKVLAPAFAAAGSDGHVELGKATAQPTGVFTRTAVAEYLEKKKSVGPKVSGRISLTANCLAP
jgi:5'-nucleotidase / UDP-sugar diphosphatase